MANWLDKYDVGGAVAKTDATRVAAPALKLTKAQLEKNKAINKQVMAKTNKAKAKEVAKRTEARNKPSKTISEVFTNKDPYNIQERFRLFPNDTEYGQVFDEYFNPAYFVADVASNLGNTLQTGDYKGAALTAGMALGAGALGFDPLGGAMKLPGKLDKAIYPTRTYRASVPGGNPTLYESSTLAEKVAGKGDWTTSDLTEAAQYLSGSEVSGGRPGLLTGQNMNLTEYKVPFWKKSVASDPDVIALKKLQGDVANPNEYIIPGNKFLYPRRTNLIQAVPENVKGATFTTPFGEQVPYYSPTTIPMGASSTQFRSPAYKYIEDQINAVTGQEMPLTYTAEQAAADQIPMYNWKQPQFAPNEGIGKFERFGNTSVESSIPSVSSTITESAPINKEALKDAYGFLERRQFVKDLQKKGLVGKEFGETDARYAARSTDKTNALTKLALDREATFYRGVKGSVPEDGIGYQDYTGRKFNMSEPAWNNEISEFENMRNAGVDFNDPISIAEYQATHVPMENYGYRSGMPGTLRNVDAIYTTRTPNNYGNYQMRMTLPRDYSQGNYSDWVNKYFKPENNIYDVAKAVDGPYTWNKEYIPDAPYEMPVTLSESNRSAVVGPRGQKMFDVDKTYPYMDYKNLSNDKLLEFQDFAKKLDEDYNTGWRGQFKNGGWLDKYNDGGPVQPNYNDYSVSAGPGFEGDGYSNVGRNYSPAWGGQFQDGGKLSFIKDPKLRNMLEGYKPGFLETVGDYRLPEGYMAGSIYPSTEVSISIGGEGGEPAYLIPSFKYGQPLQDPVQEFNMTGQHLGGPFKTWQDAEKFQEIRHQYVEKGQPLPSPIATANMAMGGSIGGATQGIPGATGFMYARTGTTPSEGKGRNKIYKTDASAQKGRKVPKELTENEIYEKETKEREAAEAASFEKYSREIEKAEAVRVAEELAKSEAFREEESRKRSERDKGRNRIDFDNLKTTQQVNDYLSYMLQENQNKIDKSGVSTIKKNIIDYINSPTYAKRQANFPEQYIGGEAERYQKNKYESTIAKNKREQRISNLSTTPVVIDKKGDANELNYFDPKLNKVILSEKNMPEVVAHELTHAATQKGERQLIDSDNVNAKYWDSVVAKSKKLPISTRLNRGEMDKFIELAREADESGARDIHADKNTNEVMFTDEQYGDLMGVRSLLYKSGITKSFGEQLDKTKMDKALNDKKIKASPVFKRLLFRYGPENVIQLNNTIAANNPQQGMPVAQNGMEMSYYQNGLDFKPKSISKNGSVIKDDMGQWAHPGEITEIGSNQITMQGVPYPVLGISDTGDTQMMYPDQEYEYDGESVTEYPMMQNGGWLDSLVDAGKSAVDYVGSFFEDPAPAPVVKPKVVPVKPKLDTYDTILDLGFNNPQRRKLQQQLDKGFDYSEDKNKIKLATGRFTGANVSSKLIDDLAAAAKRNNIPIGQLLTLAGRESTFGEEKGNTRHGMGSDSYVSGWNVAEDYSPYDPHRFLADKKVPGINVVKTSHGYGYEVADEKAVREYLKKHPNLLEQYKKKVAETPDIGNRNYFDLTAEFLKKKGVKGYNPGDPRYVQMFNKDYDTLKQDKQLMSYLTKKGYKYEQGGQLTKLDQLTNFTNYNTKQPGGWLDKYQ